MSDPERIRQLIRKIAEDDVDSLGVLYDLFYLKIYRFSSYFIKLNTLCEEVVSDVFYAIWQNRRNLLKINNIEAYLYTVTRNRSLYYLKQFPDSQVSVDDISIGYAVIEETPESIVITEELRQAVKKAVSELPDRCKLVFLMAKEEGLKYKEIAQILSISEKTVNAQMVKALKKLAEALRECDW